MKFLSALTFVSACLAPAAALKREPSPGQIANDKLKIPGDSPLELCPGDHDDDLVTIERVDLLPNPPKPGQELVIKAKGNVKQEIEKGSFVLLTVKYGLIRLISTKADLCDQISNVDLECPVKSGVLEVTKSVDLPAEIPPGKYTVLADVYNSKEEQITCLTATVSFSRGGSIFDNGFFSNEL